jgi:dihydrofolate reductase
MRSLIYPMTVSLDGFIAGPSGEIDWSAPDEELHRFHNERVRDVDLQLCGRRLSETMLVWDDWERVRPESSAVELEFAQLWRALPKLVFSSTLEEVGHNATLVRGDAVEEVARLKQEPGGSIEVGGATLAAPLIRAGLVDDFRLFVAPVVLGRGIPYFPPTEERIGLRLVETRTFGSTAVYLRYDRF